MAKSELISTDFHLKTLLISVYAPDNKTDDIESYHEEFLNLAKTYGVHEPTIIRVKLRSLDSKYFFTKGKLEEIQAIFSEEDYDEVIISDTISGQQEKNLRDLFDCSIVDRTRLILSIFEKSATSAEGKVQVEIAKIELAKTRLTGKGVYLEQQAGAVGVRGGPGETLKEQTLRHLNRTVVTLKKQLQRIENSREEQRKQRLIKKTPQLCLIGYTNAGKSSILNKLTHSNVLAEDKLFATLDTTTRQLFINSTKIGTISDTVGFIQNLPHQLIESFKSTLSELRYASLLLIVIDISDNNWKSHINVVLDTLDEIDINKDKLFVFNKIDKISDALLEQRLKEFGFFGPYVSVTATTKEGLDPLKKYLATWKRKYDKAQ